MVNEIKQSIYLCSTMHHTVSISFINRFAWWIYPLGRYIQLSTVLPA